MNRGIQVKPPKQKERDIQTDPMPLPQMMYPNNIPQSIIASQGQLGYSTTQASSNIHSSQSQKRPRIASAAIGANNAFNGASHILRDGSNGMGSDVNISEQQNMLINKGSSTGFS